MNATQTLHPVLATAIWPARENHLLRNIVLALVGTVALWLSAKIQVPLYPVPITMQTLVVLAIGVAYGPRLGAATLGLYLLEGAVGLPVFAGSWSEGGGIAHLSGPTAGYLVGFVVAAGLCGWLAERGWDRSVLFAAAAMLLGNLTIYGLGLAWLAAQIGASDAIKYGLLPFLYGDALKIAIGAGLLPLAWKLLGKRGG